MQQHKASKDHDRPLGQFLNEERFTHGQYDSFITIRNLEIDIIKSLKGIKSSFFANIPSIKVLGE